MSCKWTLVDAGNATNSKRTDRGQIDALLDKQILKEHYLLSGNGYFHFYICLSFLCHRQNLSRYLTTSKTLCVMQNRNCFPSRMRVQPGFFKCDLYSSSFDCYECFVFVVLFFVLYIVACVFELSIPFRISLMFIWLIFFK